eukprot:351111-Amorphochlora_amoeboformis.AAC.1
MSVPRRQPQSKPCISARFLRKLRTFFNLVAYMSVDDEAEGRIKSEVKEGGGEGGGNDKKAREAVDFAKADF